MCGEKSAVMVIDIDGEIEMLDRLLSKANLKDEEIKQVKETLVIKTPNGGYHLYFKYKQGLKNSVKFFEACDIRTEGGYIVAPYTRIQNDKGKMATYTPINCNSIKEMPMRLFDFIKNKGVAKKQTSGRPKKNFQNDLKKLKNMKNGDGRNDALNKILFEYCQGVKDQEIIKLMAEYINFNIFKEPEEGWENTAESVWKSINEKPEYINDKGNIITAYLVDYMIEKIPTYTDGHVVFKYNSQNGVYIDKSDNELMNEIFKLIPKEKHSMKTANEILQQLKIKTSYDSKNSNRYINCLNGILDLKTMELLSHTPSLKISNQVKANYIKDFTIKDFNKSKLKIALDNMLDEEDQKALQEFYFLCYSPHGIEVQKAFAFIGDGENGKSVAFKLIETLIGQNTISRVRLSNFGSEKGKFRMAAIVGKKANIIPDENSTTLKETVDFKSIVVGEGIQIEKKGKDPYNYTPNITLGFGFNKLPNTTDRSTGINRRWSYIIFNETFGNKEEFKKTNDNGILVTKIKDPELIEYIFKNEMDILFNWSLLSYGRLKNNKWKITQSKVAKEEKELYKLDNDSAYSFISEKIEITNNVGDTLQGSKLYKSYSDWCYKNYLTPQNNTNFGVQCRQYGLKKKKINGCVHYIGFKLK